MNTTKRWSALFMTLVLIFMCIPMSAKAEETTIPNLDEEIHQLQITMKNKFGQEVTVFFANTNTGATYRDVQCIIDDDPETSVFTIYEVGEDESDIDSYPETMDPATRVWSPPLGSTHKYKTEKTITTPSRVVRDDFVISVAKGQTTTLKKEYVGTLTGSINGKYFNKANLGIKLSITCRFSVKHKFTGPTSGKYNSREYRVKYFREDGKYIQKDYCYKLSGALYGIRTHGGTYQETVKYASYSKDSKQ